MKEKLLQYIWQFQYFNKAELQTTTGESILIIHPGFINNNQGPDFTEAKIKIGNVLMAGNIELHIQSSHWNLHKHTGDKNYSNIILHVVWEDDMPIPDAFGNALPTLVLQDRVSKILLNRYQEWMNNSFFIPCEKQIHTVNELVLANWKQRLLAERLQAKSKIIFEYLQQNNYHWEETFWWLIARNFGMKINSDAFEKIARSLPVTLLAKHKNQIQQLEALLLGQAGLLDKKFEDDYALLLQKEFMFFKKKYNLKSIDNNVAFLRMRPSNFPTVRLAQLAMLVHKSLHLFSKIIESDSLKEVRQLLNVMANDYWHYHYILDEMSSYKKKNIGKQMINNILINTVVPILFSYGLHHNQQRLKEKAVAWLEETSAEKNFITNGFTALHLANKNSFDSQSLIQLKNEYCNYKRCLDCAVGNALLKNM